MPLTVVLGEFRGDEGKGCVTDMEMLEHDIGARFNGGDNAGHTVEDPQGNVYKVHGLPTSIIHEHAKSVIGNGTVINPVNLVGEIATLSAQGIDISERNLLISGGAHLILPHHILGDEFREQGEGAQGSTKSGIAQVYADKAARIGVRAEIIKNDSFRLFETSYQGLKQHRIETGQSPNDSKDAETARNYIDCAQQLGSFVTDTVLFLNHELNKNKPARVLAEGAQAALLDIDHGMYPFVTSSSTTSGGVSTGLGVPGKHIERVIGVSKAVQSHVGGGPFVTEITDKQLLAKIHGDPNTIDAERGTTTGRTRRLGWLDLPQLRRAQMINGTTEEVITKFDWLTEERYGDELKICVAYIRKGKTLTIAPDAGYKLEQCEPVYETFKSLRKDISKITNFQDLPQEGKKIIEFLDQETTAPITRLGVGPARDQVIIR